MNDIFCEAIVKKKRSTQDVMKIIGLIVITIVVILMFPFLPYVGFLLAAGMIVLDYFCIRRLNVEYEYALTMTDLDVAKIMAKEKRKHLITIDLKQAIVIAPESHAKATAAEKENQVSKELDYTSGNIGRKVYVILVKQDNQNVKLRFEPSENMLHGIRKQLPSKTVVE